MKKLFFSVALILFLNETTAQQIITRVDSLNNYARSLLSEDVQQAQNVARYNEEQSKSIGYVRGEAISLEIIGLAYWYRDNFDSAIYFLDRSLSLFQSENDASKELDILHDIGEIYEDEGANEISLEFHLEGARKAEEIGDLYKLARFYQRIWDVYAELDLKDKALEYAYKIKSLYKNNQIENLEPLYLALKNLGILYAKQQNFDSAGYYFKEAFLMANQMGEPFKEAQMAQNLGSFFLDQDYMDSSFKYYQISYEISKAHDIKFLMTWNLQGLSAYFDRLAQQTGNKEYFEKSLLYAKDLIKLAKEIGREKRLLIGYQKAWDAYRMLGDYKNAFEYHILYEQLRYSLFENQKSEQVLDLLTKYETEKKERKIFEQQSKIEKQNIVRNALAGSSILLIIIGGLVYNRQKLSLKNKSKEKELAEIKLAQTQNELTLREQELLTYVITISQKNNLLHNLKEVAKKKTEDISEANKRLRKINMEIENGYNLSEQWEEFRRRFENIHHGFFDKLAEISPDLTNTDRRICAYLKLGLSSKQIANLQNVSEATVEVRRSQLRKKLGLQKEDNRSTFIFNIS
jgi:hypothetical protein